MMNACAGMSPAFTTSTQACNEIDEGQQCGHAAERTRPRLPLLDGHHGGSGHFYLLRATPGSAPEKFGEEYELDAFVEFVNKTGPQKKQRISKHDAAFEKQLVGKGGVKGQV